MEQGLVLKTNIICHNRSFRSDEKVGGDLSLERINTSEVEHMGHVFYNTPNLTNISGLPAWNTSMRW